MKREATQLRGQQLHQGEAAETPQLTLKHSGRPNVSVVTILILVQVSAGLIVVLQLWALLVF